MEGSAVAAPRPQSSCLPLLRVESGTLEALKWLGLALMTADHVNKYLLHDAIPALFASGRLAVPLFSFVLAYNLARPSSLSNGGYGRVGRRLAIAGVLASIPFIGLGGLVWEWWPLNVLFMLLVATGVMALLERGGAPRLIVAGLLFVLGAMVEFWWPAIAMTLAAWRYIRRPTWISPTVWIAATAALPHQPQLVGACGSAAHLPGAPGLDHDATHAARVLACLPAAKMEGAARRICSSPSGEPLRTMLVLREKRVARWGMV